MNRIRWVVPIMFLLVIAAEAGQNSGSSSLQFLVVEDVNGKPVRNAEIVLHAVDKHGSQHDLGLELKTHEDGKAACSGIAYGKLRVQVIEPGFKTYSGNYDISLPSTEITIKLQKPSKQYSIDK